MSNRTRVSGPADSAPPVPDPAGLDPFSSSYAQARQRFTAAAQRVGLEVDSHAHPEPGRDGEALALDIVVDGDRAADDWLIVSSGCHGVEGYCGSGIQTAWLTDVDRRAAARAAGVTVIHLHALNPHGFSWQRRTTHENIDLNRNFHDFTQPLPVNPGYAALHPLLVPDQWPPTTDDTDGLDGYLKRHGLQALQAAVTRGQHAFADGLFYGGVAPSWSNQTLRQVLRERLGQARRIGWIDIHTGLGPMGHGERILACRNDPAALRRARDWWGDPVTSIHDGSAVSAMLTGLMFEAIYDECPTAEYTGIALEFGTAPLMDVLTALRADQWLVNQRRRGAAVDSALAASINAQLLAAFFVASPDWRETVLRQGLNAIDAAVAGLARPRASATTRG